MNDNQSSAAKTGGLLGKTHPMIIVAAGAVTLFCAVGIGVLTGLIPSARSNSAPPAPVVATPATPALAMAPVGNADSAALPTPQNEPKSVEGKSAGQLGKPETNAPKTTAHKAPTPAPAHKTTKTSDAPTPVYAQNDKTTERPPIVVASAPPPPVCRNCGTVDSITPVEKKGEGSGAGAVIGGLLGGVVGHQVGAGRGRDVATVAGAVGGALAGNAIEKNSKTSTTYDVRVRLEDNTFQTVRYETEPGVRVGDKVKIESGRVVRN
jgi:uncharacterized protein YcfJ